MCAPHKSITQYPMFLPMNYCSKITANIQKELLSLLQIRHNENKWCGGAMTMATSTEHVSSDQWLNARLQELHWLTHWSFCGLALNYRYDLFVPQYKPPILHNAHSILTSSNEQSMLGGILFCLYTSLLILTFATGYGVILWNCIFL